MIETTGVQQFSLITSSSNELEEGEFVHVINTSRPKQG